MEPKLSRWMKQVRETVEGEIDCSACLDQIDRYVDLELSTGDASRTMPQIHHHLGMCAVCREEYEILRDLARLESAGEPPAAEELMERLKGSPPKIEDLAESRGDLRDTGRSSSARCPFRFQHE